ncbi:MAG: phosphatase PAP2 family protein [Bdellovibrionaceae bacterium]|nr:phosphatase PAP2 family protein [Pseudobdellovibrionaceae bacterium]
MKLDRATVIEWVKHDRSNKWLLLGFSTLLIGSFLLFSAEVREADAGQPELIGRLDHVISNWATGTRNPSLNAFFIFVTDLGSFYFLTALITLFAGFLLYKKRWVLAAQIVSGGLGTALITYLLKSYFARSRPDVLQMLTTVQGYSYPSGHSVSAAGIYLTMAIILSEVLHRKTSRMAVFIAAAVLATAIAISRVYLGVHYFSDITAGLMVGIAWASLNGAYFSHLKVRKKFK